VLQRYNLAFLQPIVLYRFVVFVMRFVFHVMEAYEIKLHLQGLYMTGLYSVFIQFMALRYRL